MRNYAVPLPHDQNNEYMFSFPSPIKTKATTSSENATASSVIGLTHNTTSLEVSAVGGPAVIRWIATSDTAASVVSAASGANFDHVIPTGTFRQFVVPIESYGNPQSVQGINRVNGLYQRIAYKSLGVASVLLNEF